MPWDHRHRHGILDFLIFLLNHLGIPLEEPPSIECTGKECGSPCFEGVCDGNGVCTSQEYNPCVVQGCSEKKCGEACLSGDISGVCDAEGECNFDVDSVSLDGQCGTLKICYNRLASLLNINYFRIDDQFSYLSYFLSYCRSSIEIFGSDYNF